jgi:hypothetical protein
MLPFFLFNPPIVIDMYITMFLVPLNDKISCLLVIPILLGLLIHLVLC